MTWVAVAATGWALGALVGWLLVGGGTRKPTPEPVRPLDELADLARVA